MIERGWDGVTRDQTKILPKKLSVTYTRYWLQEGKMGHSFWSAHRSVESSFRRIDAHTHKR
jgi:hypothetical protein